MLTHLIQALSVLLGLILAAVWLKRRGSIDDSYASGLTRVVMDLCLPAVVFISLSRQPLEPNLLLPGLIMLAAVLGCLGVAFLVGRSLGLARPQLGSQVGQLR